MVLAYIKNKKNLKIALSFLEKNKFKYTFDIQEFYDYIITDTILKKSLDKKIIFLLYLYEKVLYKEYINGSYQTLEKIKNYLNQYDYIISSMPLYEKILKDRIYRKIIILEENSLIIKKNIRKGKYITILDFEYKNLKLVQEIFLKFNNPIYYVGYNKLNKKDLTIYNNLDKKIIKIYDIDYFDFANLVKDSYLVIDMSDIDIDVRYHNLTILLKKFLILKDIPYYDNYLIPFKEVYYYQDNKDLINKINKIKEKRLSNLSDNAYLKIKNKSKGLYTDYLK